MGNQDFGTGKSLVVLAIVVGCFAILWPKIFYPMMQTAFAMTSPKVDSDSKFITSHHYYLLICHYGLCSFIVLFHFII